MPDTELTTPRIVHDPAAIAAAIANFRPTPKQVINGIAPHVFDERKRRPRRTSFVYAPRALGESSPLRMTTCVDGRLWSLPGSAHMCRPSG